MKISTVLFLIIYLSTTIAGKADAFSNLSDVDRLILQKEIRMYLLNNPEIIIEAVKNLENKNRENKNQIDTSLIQENYKDLFEDDISWQGGNLNGDVTIVEFLDYSCGYCRKAHKEINELIKSDKNIKLIIKEYPILGKESTLLARLTVSVLQLYNFEEYAKIHNKLMTNKIHLNENNIIELLEKLNLDSSRILNHINSNEVTEHLKRIRDLGQRLKINGTPTFVIEDTMVRGYVDLDTFETIIAKIR